MGNTDILRRAYAAFATGDIPAVLVLFHGDQVAALGWVSGTDKATGIAFQARFVH